MTRLIARIAHHPYLNLFSGLILLITASHEILRTVEGGIGTHHGVAVFGAVQLLKSLPDLMHGVDHLAKSNDIRRHGRSRM